jgi:hypothetical protein
MKLKLELGSELDINAAFDGGAVDTSVTYSVPADQQDTISVTSAGVVEALAVGTAIVQVKDTSGNLLRSIVVQVLSAADFAVQADLNSGAKELAVEFVEVTQPPAANVKISPTLSQYYEVGPSGYTYFAANFGPGFIRGAGVDSAGVSTNDRYDYLWDGNLNTYWYAQSSVGAVGYYAESATTIKEVKVWSNHQNLTARPTQIIVYGSNTSPVDLAGGYGNPSFRFDSDTGWTQIASSDITWGGTVSELRTIDLSGNTTSYKHYKLKLICAEAYVALGGIEFWGLA